jgi:hypothetical protein
MTDPVSISDAQLQRILDSNWEIVIPVFVSAFLAMFVGIILEYFKGYRERKKVSVERQKRELTQLNVAATAMGFNIESLLHIVMQQILPHHERSHAAFVALHAVENDTAKFRMFFENMHIEFTAMMTRCPEPYFTDLEFFKEIPFVLAKDPELLKLSGWMVSYTWALKQLLSERNKRIDIATNNAAESLDFQALANSDAIRPPIPI